MRRAKGVSFGRPRHTAPISLWQESAILDRPTRSSFVHLTAMAMGKRPAARQASPMWVDTADLRTSDGHPFFERLNRVLEEAGFDAFVEGLCAAFYAARMGHPSLRPGRYFRLLFIGYFEGLSSERGIAWRVTDSLSLRAFLDLDVTEAAPVVRRQLLWPLALPHLGMLPTVLRKIVLRFQPGTGQFLVTRPARARVARQHRRECVGPPPRELSSPRRRAPRWRSRRPPRPVRNRMSPSPSGTGHRTPVTEPQRHSPRSATGGAGGRAAGEAMPLPRQRSVVGR